MFFDARQVRCIRAPRPSIASLRASQQNGRALLWSVLEFGPNPTRLSLANALVRCKFFRARPPTPGLDLTDLAFIHTRALARSNFKTGLRIVFAIRFTLHFSSRVRGFPEPRWAQGHRPSIGDAEGMGSRALSPSRTPTLPWSKCRRVSSMTEEAWLHPLNGACTASAEARGRSTWLRPVTSHRPQKAWLPCSH